MKLKLRIFKYSLLAGAIYFALVSIVHFVGFKVPVLFVYFNVPSYPYQDRIISFLAFGWAVFMFSGYLNPKNKELIREILIAGIGAIAGLTIINLSTDFHNLSSTQINITYFWIETFGLFAFVFWLLYFYIQIFKKK